MQIRKVRGILFLGCFFVSQMISADDVKTYKERRKSIQEEFLKNQDQSDQESRALDQIDLFNKSNIEMTEEERIAKEDTIKKHLSNIGEIEEKQGLLFKEHKDLVDNMLNDFEALENTSKNLQDENNNLKVEFKKERSEKEKFLSDFEKICEEVPYLCGGKKGLYRENIINNYKEMKRYYDQKIEGLEREVKFSNQNAITLDKDLQKSEEKIKTLETSQGALEILYKNSVAWSLKYKFELAAGFVAATLASIGSYAWYKNKSACYKSKNSKKDNREIEVVWMQ